jgi:hypothetical protein
MADDSIQSQFLKTTNLLKSSILGNKSAKGLIIITNTALHQAISHDKL